jgi:imidazole glycerol phosphate synthase subunit HisF
MLKTRVIPCLDVKDCPSARSEARTDKSREGGRPAAKRVAAIC